MVKKVFNIDISGIQIFPESVKGCNMFKILTPVLFWCIAGMFGANFSKLAASISGDQNCLNLIETLSRAPAPLPQVPTIVLYNLNKTL